MRTHTGSRQWGWVVGAVCVAAFFLCAWGLYAWVGIALVNAIIDYLSRH